MYTQLKDLLLQAGLTEAEAAVYLELRKNPAASKWELVERTGFDRNKVYRSFEKLEQLGVVTRECDGVYALSLGGLAAKLDNSPLIQKIRAYSPFTKIPMEAVEDFEVLTDHKKMLDRYIMMAEVKYDTCLDFGDLENFVPVLGGVDRVFTFRKNRFRQMAKNIAMCTTGGPYTDCISRKDDLKRYNSNIHHVDIDFGKRWVIFSDTNDYVMFNDFADAKNPTSVMVKSKTVADCQRFMFNQFYKVFSRV